MLKFSLKSRVFADCFSTKYITVQLFDELNNWHVFPLRSNFVQDGRFFVKLNGRMLLLRIDQSKIKTYRAKGVGTVQTVMYTTQDYRPVDLYDNKVIEDFCTKNNIHKIEHIHALMIKMAALIEAQRLEKGEDVQSVSVDEVIISMLEGKTPDSQEYAKLYAEYYAAAASLGQHMFLGPIEPIASRLGQRLSNPPESLMSMYLTMKDAHWEWEKIANPSKGPFKHWALVIGIIMAAAIGGIAIWLLSGADLTGSSGLTLEDIAAASEAGLTAPDELGLDITDPNAIFDGISSSVDVLLEPPPPPPPTTNTTPTPTDIIDTQNDTQTSDPDPIDDDSEEPIIDDPVEDPFKPDWMVDIEEQLGVG